MQHTIILVPVWCTEFGRIPFLQGNGTGCDHNPDALERRLTDVHGHVIIEVLL